MPSITTVLSTIHNEMLVRWKVTMGIECALTSQRKPGEEMEDFVKRITYESTQKSRDATDFGTACHDQLEQWNLNHDYEVPASPPEKFTLTPEQWEHIRQIVNYWKDYASQNLLSVIKAERRIACRTLGLAGTVDLLAEDKSLGLAIEDYKTSGKFYNGKASFWPSFAWQLALYARMVRIEDGLSEDPRIVSHVIHSKELHPIATKVYTREQQAVALETGLTIAKLYFLKNNYRPDGMDWNALSGIEEAIQC